MADTDPVLSTGLPGLDKVLRGLMPGDNLVWQVTSIDDYVPFVAHAQAHAAQTRQPIIYFRFGTHGALLEESESITVCQLHPERGFATFIKEINDVISHSRHRALYVFDCLSELVVDWCSDRMLGNFFMLTCPHLYDVGAIAYFALFRDNHSFHATGPIGDTTQILIDVYRYQEKIYIQPTKVQHRNSPSMYMLHAWEGDEFVPVTQSITTTIIRSEGPWNRLDIANYRLGFWSSTFAKAEEVRSTLEQGGSAPPDCDEFIQSLRGMIVSHDPRILDLAKEYLTLEEILNVRRRMIGTGLIGGKAAGMLLARAIIEKQSPEAGDILEPHDSFFVGSDVFCSYLVQNGCWWNKQVSYAPEDYIEGAMRVRQQILTGTFPDYLLKHFAAMLDYFGQSPIIVRSSSLLEDAFGNSFAGKYDSVFCGNQGSPDKRMTDFLSAVRTVYASVMSEAALRYRSARGLLDKDEQMALLIQRVSGASYGSRFFPQSAGVGLSFNPFAWSDQIDPAAGMTRIVFGLGTRAVDRADDDYTRIVALNAPQRRPEADADAVRKYAQHKVDYLDLEGNQEASASFKDIMKTCSDIPVEMFASRDIALEQRAAERSTGDVFSWVLTFDKLLSQTEFVATMRTMLRTLHEAYQCPVDIEYTLNFVDENSFRINLVQCRPLQVKSDSPVSAPPHDIPQGKIVMESQGPVIGLSRVANIDRVIYVVPSVYSQLAIFDRYAVARAIGKLTQLAGARELTTALLGPGRWGSTTPALGVPIHFAEISSVDVLCEIVAMRKDLVPDVSLGTHFFSELVEAELLYVALFPDAAGTTLNTGFLEQRPSKFLELLPGEELCEKAIRVIDIESATDETLVLNASAVEQRVVCYLD